MDLNLSLLDTETPRGTATTVWRQQLLNIITNGHRAHPVVFNHEFNKTMPCDTLEVLGSSVVVAMHHPVVISPVRALSYRFMAAEAMWITDGDGSLEGIEMYNQRMRAYSDDGSTLFGAYGPKYDQQFDYVVDTLANDLSTRRAILSIWRENPPQTKDTPCTLNMQFIIRRDEQTNQLYLMCLVNMRSSDVWLGLPYDIFSFTMMAVKICHAVNMKLISGDPGTPDLILPGMLKINMGSSHLYIGGGEGLQDNSDDVIKVLNDPGLESGPCLPYEEVVKTSGWDNIYRLLELCRDERRPGKRIFGDNRIGGRQYE